MPSWWADVLQFFWSYSAWFALTVIFGGIIIQFLVRPYIKKMSKGFHGIVKRTDGLYRSRQHPNRMITIGDHKEPDLYTTHEMMALLEVVKDAQIHFCDRSSCPVSSNIAQQLEAAHKRHLDRAEEIKEEMKLAVSKVLTQEEIVRQKHLEEARIIKTEMRSAVEEVFNRDEVNQKEFLDKLLEMRRETSNQIKNGYDRMDAVLNTLLVDKTAQMADTSALLIRVVAALEKLSFDRAERLRHGEQ